MGAVISECGKYRYQLTRPSTLEYPDRGTALFIMLNPSTADADIDDPTIRRCRRFAERWGCAGIAVANLFALRSTDPKALLVADDPIGPDNDMYLRALAREYESVVFAWGANAPAKRAAEVIQIFQQTGGHTRRMWCLGKTKNGAPKHPLYIRADQPLIEFVAAAPHVGDE